MPIYDYRCEECNFQIDLNRKVEERDDLFTVKWKHCARFKKARELNPTYSPQMLTNNETGEMDLNPNCKLKRVPTCGGFTI